MEYPRIFYTAEKAKFTEKNKRRIRSISTQKADSPGVDEFAATEEWRHEQERI